MNNTRMLKNLGTRIISMGITFIVTLVITNIIVKKIGSDIYGMYQISNDFVNYATIISIALNSMASRYITIAYYDHDLKKINSYFNSILFSNIILSVSLVVPAIIIAKQLERIISIPQEYIFDIKILFLLMFINFIITICTSIFGVSTFIKNRIDLDSYRAIESNVLKFILIIVMYNTFKPRIWYLGICIILTNLYVVFRNVIYTRKLTPEVKIFNYHYFRYTYVKELISSGIWNSITKISSILLGGLDLIIANNLINTSAMGLLSIAKTIPKYIISSMSTVSSVFTPKIMIEYASKDKYKLMKEIDFSIKINSIFSLIIEVVILTLGYRIFRVWLPDQSANTLQLLSVVSMVGFIVIMPFEILWIVFTATNRVKLSSIYLMTESVIILLFMLTLLQTTNNELTKLLIIAGTSSFFEIIRGLTFLPLASAYCLGVSKKTFYKPLIRYLIAFAFSLVSTLFLNFLPLPYNAFWLIILCIATILISLFFGFYIIFNKKEKRDIYQSIKNKSI